MRFLFLVIAVFCNAAHAQVSIKVFDAGPGILSAINIDDTTSVIVDAGHWLGQSTNYDHLIDFIGSREIAVLILSHSDSDHISLTDEIVEKLEVETVYRTGLAKSSETWSRIDSLLRRLDREGSIDDRPYSDEPFEHGTLINFTNGASLQLLSGFHEPPQEWGMTGSEYYNANSIVVRLEFNGRSVLFTGDAVGRHEGSEQNSKPIATEAYLISNSQKWPIKSDIMLAPHHGGDDGSSLDFIEKVSPSVVIFSAGHQYSHPRKSTAERYIAAGLLPQCMLRTDLGDNEGEKEWSYGTTAEGDKRADDDIVITIYEDSNVLIKQGGSMVCGCI